MEQRFGYEFSNVRVHTDAKTLKSGAGERIAYTVGRDVVSVRDNTLGTMAGNGLLAQS
jgi:hypothetical protein